jgi:hypothetical protein
MAANDHLALGAIAFQLLAALDRYEVAVDQLVHRWPSREGLDAQANEVREMQLRAAELPQLRVPFVHLLIANTELLQAFANEKAPGPRVAAQKAAVEQAASELRSSATRLIRRGSSFRS